MPSGFPAFRYDPTAAPRYIQKSNPSTSDQSQRYRDSPSEPKEGVKLSKYQYPTEREPKPKVQSNPKVKGDFEKL